MKDGCAILASLLNQPGAMGKVQAQGNLHEIRSRKVHSILGSFELERGYYLKDNGEYYSPMDEALGLQDQYTPGLQKIMLWAGAMDGSFDEAEQTLKLFAGLDIPSSQIRRLTGTLAPRIREWTTQRSAPKAMDPIPTFYIAYDGTGVPMRKEEVKGRRGKQPDGSAKTREVKLGCVFTQHIKDDQGNPIRDLFSTSYVATLKDVDTLGTLILCEARCRGLAFAKQTVVIGDGAHWIWNLTRTHFPSAIQILDFYHACEHLNLLAKAIYPEEDKVHQIRKKWRRLMENGNILKVLDQARTLLPRNPTRRKQAQTEIKYFKTNVNRMRYKIFRQMCLFIGSGVVEAGCKSVVAKRTKQSGMLWSVPGVQDVLDVRCSILSHQYDNFWNYCRSAA